MRCTIHIGRRDFDDTPDDSMGGPIVPRLSFTYDINGDGESDIRCTAMSYPESDMFGVTIDTAIDAIITY